MIEIIPAIDIIDGKCVRLTQGDYAQSIIYGDDPVAVAKQFEAAGFRRLHLVDLDGARSGKVKNISVLENIAGATALSIDFSGGVRDFDACQEVINAGAALISIGSMAVKQPEIVKEWMEYLGKDRFILGADVKDGHIVVNGWLEHTELKISDFISDFFDYGVRAFFCTDVAKDGMLQGPATELYREIVATFKGINLIASGGVASVQDIKLLEEAGCSGTIIGKALYEGTIKIEDLC